MIKDRQCLIKTFEFILRVLSLYLGVEEELWGTVPEGHDLRGHRSHGQPVVPGQTKVGYLDAAFVGHEQVRHLEVAVHDEVGM